MSAVAVRSQTACLHELIEFEARRQPGAIAVVCGDDALTYAALNGRANALASRLVEAGVGPDSRVGVYLTHSVDMAAALLGVLKAGGAYIPLDPGFPADRVQQALGNAPVAAVVTTTGLASRLPPTPARIVPIDDLPGSDDAANLGPRASIDNLAYVMYTSGSTGRPKGVLIPHRSLVEGYLAWEEAYRLRTDIHVHCQMGSFAFGVFHLDFARALCSGGTLVLCPPSVVMSPPDLYEVMVRQRVDFAEFVPAALRGLVRHCRSTGRSLEFLNTLVVGSDRWYIAEHRALRSLCRPRARIIHSFGLTETGDTAYFEGSALPLADGQLVPIGRPFPNIHAYVLDADLAPVPKGEPGELFIGGSGIARGMSGRPDLTAKKFIPDPFSARPGARMYRTGDQARVLADGNIEFLGRLDQMVKIRGFRVEPGEVEVVLKAHPAVADSVVMPRDDASGATGLVAYVVPANADAASVTALRDHLRARLPDYMMPSAFVRLDRLPLTPSGKVDRLALPAPGRQRPDLAQPLVAPRDAREHTVAAVFADVLGVDEVGAEDNFFELGGHSLLAAMAAARLADEFNVELRVRDLFDYPVVAQLAQRTKTIPSPALGNISLPRSRGRVRVGAQGGDTIPLSYAQQQLWLLDQLEPKSPLYNEFELYPFMDRLDRRALERSLTELLRRHEVLRTTFQVVEGEPVQVIGTATEMTLDVIDVSRQPNPAPAAREHCLTEVQRPFDLAKGPLFRAALVKLGPEEHWLLLSMHHVVTDAWSMDVLRKELRELYAAFAAGEPSRLPALPVQYADYAAWQRQRMQGEVLQRELEYWKQQLAGAPDVMGLPTDRPRPRVQSYRGATQYRMLPAALAAGLRDLGQRQGATLFMTILAGFGVLLHRYTGEADLVVGSPVGNRSQPDVAGLLGYFVNTLALRVRVAGAERFRELLARVRDVTLSAYEHQELPFEKLVAELRPQRALSHNPLFQVLFSHQVVSEPMPVPEWQPIIPVAKFDLALFVRDAGDRIGLACEYSTDLFEDATVSRLLDNLLVLLEALVEDPGQRVADLPLLAPAERQRVLVEWNQTAAPYQREACLHQLFEAQVGRTPNAVAARFGGEILTYSELNRRANQLAHHLHDHGVAPEVYVGLCLERSLDLLVGLLAVLKAGGAYVPLDAAYPRERLAFMLRDAGIQLVVTQLSLLPALPEGAAACICLDRDADAIAGRPDSDPDAGAGAENLAYIIYTSGSTGTPKGVAMPHRPPVNLIAWQTQRSGLSRPRTVLQFAPVSFDVSVQEIFSALSCGATVVLVPEEIRKDPLALASYVEANAVQRLFIPVAALHQLAELPLGDRHKLREISDVITAGEQLQVTAAVRSLFASLPHASLHNHYGPAETHAVTSYQLDGPPSSWPSAPPIGRPISNARLYVLDAELEPVPMGVAGDIYIGGDSVARGYLGRPALTADRFIPDPFSPQPGARMYRTGDRGRIRDGGVIEFLGRLDHQVKVRGFRIELGEIEAVIGQHPGVVEAAVAIHDNSPPPAGDGGSRVGAPDRRLVAYVVLGVAGKPGAAELRQFLRDRLPDYMVPNVFVELDRLPMTPSGKVDRRALPRPDRGRRDLDRRFVAAVTDVERTIVDAWAEVLGVERVGLDDNFFDLGGHSLLATQVVVRLRARLNVDLGVRDLFDAPTARELAHRAESLSRTRSEDDAPLVRRHLSGRVPATFSQERVWFLDQLRPELGLFNVFDVHPLAGRLDRAALTRTLTELSRRHQPLRTTFELVDGRPMQVIGPASTIESDLVDVSHEADPVAAAFAYSQREGQRPFDLARGPLFRPLVIRLGPEEHQLLFALHHSITDGWSMTVLWEEFQVLYEAFKAGVASPLPELPVEYADYVAWLRARWRGPRATRELAYWTQQLDGAPYATKLPTDRPHPQVSSHRGATQTRFVSAALAQKLLDKSQAQGASLFMTLLATLNVLLHRHTGERDQVIGIAVANRSRPEFERMVGLFSNLLALRTRLDGEESFRQLLDQVRQVTLGAYEHQELPFEFVLAARRPEWARRFNPLFNVAFSHNVSERASFTGKSTPAGPAPAVDQDSTVVAGPSRYDLLLVTADAPQGFRIAFDYSKDLFDDATVRRMLDDLIRLLEEIAA
jgi:amino acid adenylation domain-containing protein